MKKSPSRAQREAEAYSVALENFPEFACQLGVLISCFAILESYIPKLIAQTTKIDEPDAFAVVGCFMSFSSRVDLLEVLLKRRDQKLREVIAAKYFVAEIREATKIRNMYAHGSYSLGFVGDSFSPAAEKFISISSFSQDSKRKAPAPFIRSIDGIKQDVARIKFITCELHGYVFRNEAPESTKNS